MNHLEGTLLMNQQSKIYLTESEAAHRYGYSRQWFQRERWKGTGPCFIKVNGGRVLYPIDATDAWFSNCRLQQSTSTMPIKHTEV